MSLVVDQVQGKSTLAQMLALDTALKNKGVLFVSAEMDKETLANRMISALSLIPYDELHNARMSSGVLNDFTNAQACLCQNSGSNRSKSQHLSEVRTYVRKAERRYKKIGLGCIVIDYLQFSSQSEPKRPHSGGGIQLAVNLSRWRRNLNVQ